MCLSRGSVVDAMISEQEAIPRRVYNRELPTGPINGIIEEVSGMGDGWAHLCPCVDRVWSTNPRGGGFVFRVLENGVFAVEFIKWLACFFSCFS